jgi:hypothetical protein
MNSNKINIIQNVKLRRVKCVTKRQIRKTTRSIYHCNEISLRQEQLWRMFVCHHLDNYKSHGISINLIRRVSKFDIYMVPLPAKIRADIINCIYHNYNDNDYVLYNKLQKLAC